MTYTVKLTRGIEPAICRALGFDPDMVSRIELYFSAGEPARFIVHFITTPEQAKAVGETLEKFKESD